MTMRSVADMERELLVRAANVLAATAALAETLVEFDLADGWHGAGIRSIEDPWSGRYKEAMSRLPAADPDRYADEIERVLGLSADDILRISAKTGEGVPELLDAIVERIPPAGRVSN